MRKDLSHLGSYGIRGVGYDVDYLVYQVSRALGLTQNWPVVIVGAGNLGRALANSSRSVRLPGAVHTDVNRLRKARRELVLLTGSEPTNEELAAELDLPVERIGWKEGRRARARAG